MVDQRHGAAPEPIDTMARSPSSTSSPDRETGPGEGRSAFPTTRWSLVVQAGSVTQPQARAALESLCRLYWYPIYAFARRQGRSHHEAEDRTQDFLSVLIGDGLLSSPSPARGRFRAYLLTALRHFLIDDWRSEHAAKRGGAQRPVSLDMHDGDERFSQQPADPGMTPEQAFDRNWAVAMCDATMDELQSEYRTTGKAALFDALRPMILARLEAGCVKVQAAPLGLTDHAFTVALHRLRKRFGERLRLRVSDTVSDGEEVNAELRHLIQAIGGDQPRGA